MAGTGGTGLAGLQQTEFGGIKFPAETIELQGVGRHHVHEYPHAAGGSPEKLGRALWRIRVRAVFADTFPAYPGLWPDGLKTLRLFFQQQQTKTLIHPTCGEIEAFITDFQQHTDFRRKRSGEACDITFLEDQDVLFISQLADSADADAVATTGAELNAIVAEVKKQLALSAADVGLFTALQTAVNGVVAIKDTADMYGNLLDAKLQAIVSMATQLDNALSLQDPRAWPIVDALQDLWRAAVKFRDDLQTKSVKLQHWTVPVTMSFAAIAAQIYKGDTSRAGDLMALNAQVPDPLNVKAGTDIRYYPDPTA
jgi:prophage DNA circulation protein